LAVAASVVVAATAQAFPTQQPDQCVPKFNSGKILDIEDHNLGPLVAGEGIGGLHWMTPSFCGISRTYPVGTSHDAIVYDNDVVTGASGNKLQRWDRNNTSSPVWSTDFGGEVRSIEYVPGTTRAVVSGWNSEQPMVIVDLRDGRIVRRPDINGYIFGADLSPDGTRLVIIGKKMIIEGDASRPHIAVMGVSATARPWLRNWDLPKANFHCGRMDKNDPNSDPNPNLAYIRDVEWAPAGTSQSGNFIFVTTGIQSSSTRGYCDRVVMANGRSNQVIEPDWVNRTCGDTVTSVAWSPNGRYAAVGGHFKCLEWKTGGARDYGADRNNPWTRSNSNGDMRDRNNRMGMAILHTGQGNLHGARRDMCRAYGAEAMTWTTNWLAVGKDCGTYGNNEGSNLHPEDMTPTINVGRLMVFHD